jgi:hypothetical protein
MKYKLMAMLLISSLIAVLSACGGSSGGENTAEKGNWDKLVWDKDQWQ